MNADDFVFQARKYGYSYVTRVVSSSYHVIAENDKKETLHWIGPSRIENGGICKTFANLLSDSAKVQKVVDEVRSN